MRHNDTGHKTQEDRDGQKSGRGLKYTSIPVHACPVLTQQRAADLVSRGTSMLLCFNARSWYTSRSPESGAAGAVTSRQTWPVQ